MFLRHSSSTSSSTRALFLHRALLSPRGPTSPSSTSQFHSLPSLRSSSHETHYDPPTGNLFNVPPGQKYEKEGWETIWYWGFYGSLGLAAIAYCFKPDTSIQTWALEEARRRLEREGILKDPEGRSMNE